MAVVRERLGAFNNEAVVIEWEYEDALPLRPISAIVYRNSTDRQAYLDLTPEGEEVELRFLMEAGFEGEVRTDIPEEARPAYTENRGMGWPA